MSSIESASPTPKTPQELAFRTFESLVDEGPVTGAMATLLEHSLSKEFGITLKEARAAAASAFDALHGPKLAQQFRQLEEEIGPQY